MWRLKKQDEFCVKLKIYLSYKTDTVILSRIFAYQKKKVVRVKIKACQGKETSFYKWKCISKKIHTIYLVSLSLYLVI